MTTQEFKFEENLPINVLSAMKNEETWFIASDVCNVLELPNVTRAMERLDEDEKQIIKINFKGQLREVNVINESGLYALVITSEKPNAKTFRKWITSVVLPSIRKSGKYTTEKAQKRQQQMLDLTSEIEKIENDIDFHKRETRELSNKKDAKYKLLRYLITMDDSQYELEFIE